MTRFVALLRAVNVAGHGKVAMGDLRAMFKRLGFADVATLLQSGNVAFAASGKSGAALERLLETAAAEQLGLKTDFFVRDAKEWAAAIRGSPFPEVAKRTPGFLVLMALKDAPKKDAVRALQDAIKGRETVRAGDRHLYITYPDGIGRSKLTNVVIEKALGTRGTARNWNTVMKVMGVLG